MSNDTIKAKIIRGNDGYRYYDKNGTEIHDGDYVKGDTGKIEKVLLTTGGMLGRDATNPIWIESGKAGEGEYGIYPFSLNDLLGLVKVENKG